MQRNRHHLLLLVALIIGFGWSQHSNAQDVEPVLACGDTIAGQAGAAGEPQRYPIFVPIGENETVRLVVQAQPLPLGALADPLALKVIDANAFEFASMLPMDAPGTLETEPLTRPGVYDIEVTGTPATPYQLLISCVQINGTVTSNNNRVQGMTCGQIVENTYLPADTLHLYAIVLIEGDTLQLSVEPLQQGNNPLSAAIYAPDDAELPPETATAPQTGVYRVVVVAEVTDELTYRVSADCTLGNGQRILPDENDILVLEPTMLDTPPFQAEAANTVPDFSAQAAPAVPASTAADIVVPLELDTPNNGVITPDFDGVYAYQFEAEAGDTYTLDVERLTGNLSLGVVVASDSTPALFEATLVGARTTSTEFTVPTAGTYAIRIAATETGLPGTPQTTGFSIRLTPVQ